MVGINGSAVSAAALGWALREAALRGAVLQVVHAWQPAARGRAPYAPGPGASAAGKLIVARRGPCSPRRSGTRTRRRPWPLTAAALRLEAAEGLPARVLLDRACGAELLVLGGLTAPPGGGSHQPVSPVALACLRAAPCPVVVVTSRMLASALAVGPLMTGAVLPAEPREAQPSRCSRGEFCSPNTCAA